jgi:hypothetical protein
MKVSLTIEATIGARYKLTPETALKLCQRFLPGSEPVRVTGGKYTYLVVFEDRNERGEEVYGKWVAHPLGECRMCGRDTMGSGEYCGECRGVRLSGDEVYYNLDSCVDLVGAMVERERRDNNE